MIEPGKNTWMLFTFVDLFSGIGGTRLAFERAGGKCVFSAENDKFACITYKTNFNVDPTGDVLSVRTEDIPPFDILVAGFPCQPFSLAGVSKRESLNMKHGFQCEDKGNLFFRLVEILREKRPKAFLLENVKNLISHNRGRTYYSIKKLLTITGYDVYEKVIDARVVVPQHRERVYIVGFRNDLNIDFDFSRVNFPLIFPRIKDILEDNVPEKYTLSDKLWNYLQEYKIRHRKRGNGFGYSLVELNKHTRTLSSRYYKDGAEILIPQSGKNPRKLTPRECARLMGFSDDFKIPVSNTQAYKQFGNSVVIPVVDKIAAAMIECLIQDQNFSPMSFLFNDPPENDSNPIFENTVTTLYLEDGQKVLISV